MKALFISNDAGIADAESPVRARMRAYAKEIGTLHIVMRSGKDAVTADGPLTIHEIKAGRIFALFRISSYAHALIQREGIEIVSAQDPFEYGRAALKAIRGTGARLHIQVHTDFLSPWFTRDSNPRAPKVPQAIKNRIRQRIADYVLPHADGIRTVSKRVQESIVARYGSSVAEPSVVPIEVPSVLPPRVSLPEHPFTFALMTVSRLEPEKRIDDILVGIAQIVPDFPSVGIFIAGDGSERKHLEALAQKLRIEDRVVFLGWRTDALGIMQSAQAYIQASAYEGYGMALIEAALARLPIITTDVGVVGEVFRGYEEVFSVPPGDPTGLGACIKSLVGNHQSREVLGRNAEQAARAHLAQYQNQPRMVADDLERTLSAPARVIQGKA